MNNQIKSTEIDGEKIYLKKDKFGYRIVSPIKNEDGSLNWFNLLVGGKRGLLNLIIVAVILTLLFVGFQQVTEECSELAEDPCKYCQNGLNSPYDDSVGGFDSELFLNFNENEGVIANEHPEAV